MLNKQIVALYENDNLTIEQIAEATEMDKEAVELALMHGSVIFRKQAKKDPKLFSEDTFETAKMVMESLCLGAENEGVKLKAAKFIIDENLGRNNAAANIKQTNIFGNITMFEDRLARAKEAKERAKAQPAEIIDVNAA
jgi:hypothetical protein